MKPITQHNGWVGLRSRFIGRMERARIFDLLPIVGMSDSVTFARQTGKGSFWNRYADTLEFILRDIRDSYLATIQRTHPDKGGNTVDAAQVIAAWTRIKKLFAQKGVFLSALMLLVGCHHPPVPVARAKLPPAPLPASYNVARVTRGGFQPAGVDDPYPEPPVTLLPFTHTVISNGSEPAPSHLLEWMQPNGMVCLIQYRGETEPWTHIQFIDNALSTDTNDVSLTEMSWASHDFTNVVTEWRIMVYPFIVPTP
jgi:hypothetical protein